MKKTIFSIALCLLILLSIANVLQEKSYAYFAADRGAWTASGVRDYDQYGNYRNYCRCAVTDYDACSENNILVGGWNTWCTAYN